MADLTDPAGQAPARVDLREEDGTTVVRLSGDLDMTSTEHVRAAIVAALGTEPDRVVIDAAGLAFIDSSGIALLVSMTRDTRHIEVRNPAPIVRRLLELTGLSDILHITP